MSRRRERPYKEEHEVEEEEEQQQQEEEEDRQQQRQKKKQKKKAGPADSASIPLYLRLSSLEKSAAEHSSSLEADQHLVRAIGGHKKLRKRLRSQLEDDNEEEEGDEESVGEGKAKKFGRAHKNAPAVMRSDRPVRRLRDNANNTSRKAIDPRFSDMSGKLQHNKFLQSFSFLDQYQEDEVKKLARAAKKTKSVERKQELKVELQKRTQEMVERRRSIKIKERMQQVKAVEREKVKAGKKPFFLKESAKKEIALEERYEELKRDGKLRKFMAKKRSKNAHKDARWLPGQV